MFLYRLISYAAAIMAICVTASCRVSLAADEGATSEDKSVATLNVRPGLEVKRVKGANLLLPIGGQVHKAGGAMIIEGGGEYAGRKYTEIDERLDKIETDMEELKREIAELKGAAVFKKELKSGESEE